MCCDCFQLLFILLIKINIKNLSENINVFSIYLYIDTRKYFYAKLWVLKWTVCKKKGAAAFNTLFDEMATLLIYPQILNRSETGIYDWYWQFSLNNLTLS